MSLLNKKIYLQKSRSVLLSHLLGSRLNLRGALLEPDATEAIDQAMEQPCVCVCWDKRMDYLGCKMPKRSTEHQYHEKYYLT